MGGVGRVPGNGHPYPMLSGDLLDDMTIRKVLCRYL
jgi:hypothetical protein